MLLPTAPHSWDLSPTEAVAVQKTLHRQVILEDQLPETVQRVAGIDVGFEDRGAITRAAVAVLDYPSLALVESHIARRPTQFPYVVGPAKQTILLESMGWEYNIGL